MRILSERTDPDGEGHAGQESAPHRRADPRNDERDAVPVHELLPCPDGRQTSRQDAGRCFVHFRKRGGGMSISDKIPTQIEELLLTNRRGFLRSAGLLAVSFGAFSGAGLKEADAQSAAAQGP